MSEIHADVGDFAGSILDNFNEEEVLALMKYNDAYKERLHNSSDDETEIRQGVTLPITKKNAGSQDPGWKRCKPGFSGNEYNSLLRVILSLFYSTFTVKRYESAKYNITI